MAAYDIDVTGNPAAADLDRLRDGLGEHAQSTLSEDGFAPVAAFARDADGNIVGGISGKLNWNWLEISLLWVDPRTRGTGLGATLLERLERHAAEHGCTHAHVDTFSFQARGFYEKAGYGVFATLKDYPPGHARHYLRRQLLPLA